MAGRLFRKSKHWACVKSCHKRNCSAFPGSCATYLKRLSFLAFCELHLGVVRFCNRSRTLQGGASAASAQFSLFYFSSALTASNQERSCWVKTFWPRGRSVNGKCRQLHRELLKRCQIVPDMALACPLFRTWQLAGSSCGISVCISASTDGLRNAGVSFDRTCGVEGRPSAGDPQ